MTVSMKEKWYYLYGLAQEIASFEPWDRFSEDDKFSYIWKDESKVAIFSFISDSAGKYGIACYSGEEAYLRARKRLTKRNEKHEPLFMLQDTLICLWDNREDISKKSYDIIKELGFKPRGKGAWLHFDRYQTGYVPVPINEKEVDFMTTAFENLHMMLKAVYEKSLDPEFDKGKSLVRWYDSKDKLYYTHPLKIELPKTDLYPQIVVGENSLMKEICKMPTKDYSIQLDWSYIDIIFEDDDGTETFPQLLLITDSKSGYILVNEMLSPKYDKPKIIFNMICYIVTEYGKPSEIAICDQELRGILEDFCCKINIKLKVKRQLNTISEARRKILYSLQ